jgi:ketosteroid isomerase-like protein
MHMSNPRIRIRIISLAVCALAAIAIRLSYAGASAPLVDQVRNAETAFAKTMADRDFTAFADYVAAEAIFFGGKGPLIGKAAVLEGWKSLYEGPDAPFSWKPEVVQVLASGTLAHSSGPVLDAAGKRIGTFNSVWQREMDGKWRVVFDKGCDVCNCAPAS